jgi:hypothetical protein
MMTYQSIIQRSPVVHPFRPWLKPFKVWTRDAGKLAVFEVLAESIPDAMWQARRAGCCPTLIPV